MSESDDTDILLLIPPDYFLNTAEAQLQQQRRQNRTLFSFYNRQDCPLEFEPLFSVPQLKHTMTEPENLKADGEQYNEKDEHTKAVADLLAMPPPPQPSTAAYMFLPPEKKAELNHINSRLQSIEQHTDFDPSSDISTISDGTVRTQLHHSKACRGGYSLAHSTPKCGHSINTSNNVFRKQRQQLQCDPVDDGVLAEIDNFFDNERRLTDGLDNWNHHSDDYGLLTQRHRSLCKAMTELDAVPQVKSLPGALNRLSLEQPSGNAGAYEYAPTEITLRNVTTAAAADAAPDNNLISLSEIWGKSGQATNICTGVTKSALKEELLRRQHLEKTVHLLQSRLLEYQQRLSVAIEVDRAKDGALSTAQQESKSMRLEIQQLHEALQKAESIQQGHDHKVDVLQKELAQAVTLATKFQDKNEKIEAELIAVSRKSDECNNMNKQKLEELEHKVEAFRISEEFAINELNKFKDKCVRAEYQNEKLKTHSDELEKECATLRQQKETLQELQQKQKTRSDALEQQKMSLQDALKQQNEVECVLKRKIELQQKSLKSHYQKQLENVVAQKMKEFQGQLDKTEETLKTEARERERLIADRAVRQLEMISEKSDLELNLLQEKHDEEIALYRIQLASASKKIDDLETKLNGYKSKRADIAEKLHDVMEIQWQKALELLTSPNQSKQANINSDAESPNNNETARQEYDNYRTPQKRSKTKENNLNAEKCKELAPIDRLQAYIELLLSKSPSDFDKLDEILELSKKTRSTAGKLRSTSKRNNIKPPWKS